MAFATMPWTAEATHGLLRAYHPTRRAAVVAPAKIEAFKASMPFPPSQPAAAGRVKSATASEAED